MAQFVPVKLDISTAEYKEWRQDHQYEGKTIPILFVVRADGETLYGKSGSLSGDELPKMLSRALEHSGGILNAKDSETLTTAAANFQKLKDSGEVASAVKALNRVARIGMPGRIPSFAQSALTVNKLATTTGKEILSKLEKCKSGIDSGDTESQLAAILEFLKTRREYGALKIVKTDLGAFLKELGKNKAVTQLLKEAKIIDSAISATSKTAIARAKTKLTALVESTQIEAIKAKAKLTLNGLAD